MAGRTKEEIKSLLSNHRDEFQQMKTQYSAVETKWSNEIAMLERRVNTLYEDIDLGNGDKIAVRTALSQEETEEYNALDHRKMSIGRDDPEQNEIAYRQLEILTANPYLTADWFRENRDKWPVIDTLRIVAGFVEQMQAAAQDRVKSLQKFRQE